LCATFFIATGFLDGGRMWNDSVIESVRRCASDAIELDLPADAGRIRLELGTMAERRAAIDRILAAIKYLPADERRAFTERLLRSLNVEADDRLMMTSEQVRALRRAGMQIGAHTVSHPILARLDDGAAYEEVARSKQALEALLGEPVPLFAYPNGRSGQDFTAASVDIARKAGFEAAVTTDRGAAHAATDRFRLPRYTPWERPRLRFGARLAQNLWQSNRSSAT
jgi:peptidoglycan/xylan/chitin deacetylase (PgdA/CDA1 family)